MENIAPRITGYFQYGVGGIVGIPTLNYTWGSGRQIDVSIGESGVNFSDGDFIFGFPQCRAYLLAGWSGV